MWTVSSGPPIDVVRPADEQYSEFPRRHSFLIDDQGVIRKVYIVTDVAQHAAEVLADLETLQR